MKKFLFALACFLFIGFYKIYAQKIDTKVTNAARPATASANRFYTGNKAPL